MSKNKTLVRTLWALAIIFGAALVLIPLVGWWWWAINGLDARIGQAWFVTWFVCWPLAGAASLAADELS